MTLDHAPERRRFGPRRIAFTIVVTGFIGLCALMSPLPYVLLGWFMETPEGGVSHAVHEISFGAMFAAALVGLIPQLRHAERRISLAYQVAVSIGVLLAFALAINRIMDPVIAMFGTALVLSAVLHPAGRKLLRPQLEPSPVLGAAAVIVAVPFAWFAVAQTRLGVEAAGLFQSLAGSLPPDAGEEQFSEAITAAGLTAHQAAAVEHSFHWSAMAAFALSCALLAIIAALRAPGWKLVGWTAGALVGIYGAASLTFPGDASAASAPWAVLALVWAVAFIVLTQRSAPAALPEVQGLKPEPGPA